MKKFVYSMTLLFMVGCIPGNYTVYRYDNRDDIYHDGMRRIVDKHGRIGYTNQAGKVVVRPKYAFGYPFENGQAKVTKKGMPATPPPPPGGANPAWESNKWHYIDKQGKTQKQPAPQPGSPAQPQVQPRPQNQPQAQPQQPQSQSQTKRGR